jgi:Cys-tRNA synthase (O-phospho-L-seryl-tRNA:Cys-tRNA synthase)
MLIRSGEGYAVFICDKCKRQERIKQPDIKTISDNILNAKMLTIGWKVSKSGMRHTCPVCNDNPKGRKKA